MLRTSLSYTPVKQHLSDSAEHDLHLQPPGSTPGPLRLESTRPHLAGASGAVTDLSTGQTGGRRALHKVLPALPLTFPQPPSCPFPSSSCPPVILPSSSCPFPSTSCPSLPLILLSPSLRPPVTLPSATLLSPSPHPPVTFPHPPSCQIPFIFLSPSPHPPSCHLSLSHPLSPSSGPPFCLLPLSHPSPPHCPRVSTRS